MARDHSADAGGNPSLLEGKRALREEVWEALRAAGAARFPGARGRIPNFTGAEAAAERLRDHPRWRTASAIKANPDAPQWPVRQRALSDGLVLLMAVPRLAEAKPFLLLDPARLPVTPRAASSIKGATEHGQPVGADEAPTVDLVISGSVAVDPTGARLGKGGGFADLEFALATTTGLIRPETLVATTVHPLQVIKPGRIPMTPHDVPLDLIITPDELIQCPRRPRPTGVHWAALTPEKIAAIPLLATLASSRARGRRRDERAPR